MVRPATPQQGWLSQKGTIQEVRTLPHSVNNRVLMLCFIGLVI
jgi:hypothetical protein